MKTTLHAFFLAAVGVAGVPAQTTPPPISLPEQQSATSKARPAWEREWAYLSKYREANARLAPPAAGEKRVVFLGDSITEAWAADDNFFPGKPYVNRGIGGQTTAQLLVRFRQDVIGLRPAVVVILAGTNDLAENGGPTTLEAIEDNLQSMAELARLNGIRVVLASVLPVLDYPWRTGLQPADKISALNRWIAEYCAKNHLVNLDYYSAMVDEKRGLRADLTKDGVHPTSAGYAVMMPLAEKAIREALK
jgi:lysophospholipase L1-like esterase